MKIAYILPSLANRGPIIFTKYLLDAMKEMSVSFEVFYLDDCEEETRLDFSVPCTKISFLRKYDFSNFDIVHTTMAKPDLYAQLFVAKEKWISSMHNYIYQDLKMLYKNNFIKYFVVSCLWMWALSKSKNLIVSSNAMLLYYQEALKKANFSLIPYGITEKRYFPITETADLQKLQFFKDKGLFVIGAVGLLIYRKGFHQLIPILQKNQDVALVLIGEGKERKNLEKLAEDASVKDRIFMPGFRDNSYNYYQFFDAYAHVSYSEGFGLAMLEALSHKLPLVCSRLDIYRDYFQETDVAYFDLDDECSLQDALNKVRKNIDFYSGNSYRLFSDNFSSIEMAKRHIDLYTEISDMEKKSIINNLKNMEYESSDFLI